MKTKKSFFTASAPAEQDYNLRTFSTMTPEGEIYQINTADPESPFYGPVWTRILSAQENGEFIRGKAVFRRVSAAEDRFSGYSVSINGVHAFLPASKAGWFYHPENDAAGKCLALAVENVYTSGDRVGNLIVNAWKPLKYILKNQPKGAFAPGSTPFALAMDYSAASLIFPCAEPVKIEVPLADARYIARSNGMDDAPGSLTGLYWQLRITGRKADNLLTGTPIAILL